jgi:acetyl esterase/lipase
VRPEDRSVLSRPASPPDAVVPYGSDAENVADLRLGSSPAAERPLVVLVHGGFWRPEYDRLHLRPLTEALSAAGWCTALPEYRRVPGEPDLAVADVHRAVTGLPGHPRMAGRTDGRVVLVGHSAGGHLALQAAARTAVAGVLALAPVADLRLAEELALGGDAVTAFLGAPAATRADLDPVRLPTPAGRVHLVHGDGDGIVPVAVSASYRAAHPEAQLTVVPAGHFALIDPGSAVWPEVLSALHAVAAAG